MTHSTPANRLRYFNMTAFIVLMTGLPVWVWYCLIAVTRYDGALVWPDTTFWSHIEPPSVAGLLFYGGWLLLQATLYHWLPGKPELGQPLPDGSRLPYRLNGLLSFVITLALWGGLHVSGLLPGDFIYRHLPTILGTANVLVFALCFYVFFLGRSQASAEEKQLNWLEAFFLGAARNPPTYIQTKRGTKLLTSGWWGIASHANYLGDLLLSLAMGLTVGSNTIFGYGYFLAFIVLLVHRDWRDDRHCAEKYGDDWKAYRAKVRWHIIPGIY